MTAIVTGSFDPITIGHEDIINRASKLFGFVIVAVANNPEKTAMFSADERFEAVSAVFEGRADVKVIKFSGLAASLAQKESGVIIRGARGSFDFEYEKTLFEINRELFGVDTVVLPSKAEYSFISSAFVRELISHGHPYEKYIPESAAKYLSKTKNGKRRN